MNAYDNMTQAELIAVIQKQQKDIEFLSHDISFNILKKEAGVLRYNNLHTDAQVVFIDLCNVHAGNHFFTMDGYDELVKAFTRRITDVAIKFGGDEIVIILDKNVNVWSYMQYVASVMAENNIYAVIAATTACGTLLETAKKLDKIVSAEKLAQEKNGEKPARDAEYVCLDSTIIYAV